MEHTWKAHSCDYNRTFPTLWWQWLFKIVHYTKLEISSLNTKWTIYAKAERLKVPAVDPSEFQMSWKNLLKSRIPSSGVREIQRNWHVTACLTACGQNMSQNPRTNRIYRSFWTKSRSGADVAWWRRRKKKYHPHFWGKKYDTLNNSTMPSVMMRSLPTWSACQCYVRCLFSTRVKYDAQCLCLQELHLNDSTFSGTSCLCDPVWWLAVPL